MTTSLVAVYGSLKKGKRNHGLLSDSRCVCHGLTEPKFSLVDLVYFPGLIDGDNFIEVEVYEVTNEMLSRLDRLEGHPTFYERVETDIYVNNIENPMLKCFIYKYKGNNSKNLVKPYEYGVVSW